MNVNHEIATIHTIALKFELDFALKINKLVRFNNKCNLLKDLKTFLISVKMQTADGGSAFFCWHFACTFMPIIYVDCFIILDDIICVLENIN